MNRVIQVAAASEFFLTLAFLCGCQTGPRPVDEPIEFALLVQRCLVTRDPLVLAPYLFSHEDLQAVAIPVDKINRPSPKDDMAVRNLEELAVAVRQATSLCLFEDSTIISCRLGKLGKQTVLFEIINVRPTDVIEGFTLELETAGGGKRVVVETGDLIRVGNSWKLYGTIKITEVR